MRTHIARAARHSLLALGLLAVSLFALGALLTPAARADTNTVISLTFDDSNTDRYTQAFPIMQQHGMHGTFYTVTGTIGVNPGTMTLPQLQSLSSAGNEIAGHTVLHPDLTQLSTDEATREICQSRATLLNWGFPVTDFAYPYDALNSTVAGIAGQCGYNSSRGDSQLKSPTAAPAARRPRAFRRPTRRTSRRPRPCATSGRCLIWRAW